MKKYKFFWGKPEGGKMNPEIKARWVEALRSGKYRQGKSFLREGDQYCCLGVLCELAAKDGVIGEPVPKDTGWIDLYAYEECELTPPARVDKWAGMEGFLWAVNYNGESTYLSELNDSFDLTFPEIADLIEEQL